MRVKRALNEASGIAIPEPRIPLSDFTLFPDQSGVYLLHADVALPGLERDCPSGPCYVGRARDSIRRRMEREHLGDTGRSTLRRSLGALLKEELSLTAVPRAGHGPVTPARVRNFTFAPEGDERLTEWMKSHLSVALVVEGDPVVEERRRISELHPPLNLQGWTHREAGGAIRAARARCREEAAGG